MGAEDRASGRAWRIERRQHTAPLIMMRAVARSGVIIGTE
jgi:hypothetical protein